MTATCTTSPLVIRGSSHIDPSSLVRSAELVAVAVIDGLAQCDCVTVDLAGLKGLSSSYFNLILKTVAARYGPLAVQTRLHFKFASAAQNVTFDRSLQAVLSAAE